MILEERGAMSETGKASVEEQEMGRLLDKSQEAFILGVEIFNRPTIRYRVEGCAFFLCNAWELMLKSHIISTDGFHAVYYPVKDHEKPRSLSLTDCLKKVYTNAKDPLRQNMNRLVELRNTSTHFVIEEYELTYLPILQACVKNYDEQLRRFHGIEICDRIPENYMVLSVNGGLVPTQREIRSKYSKQIADRLFDSQRVIADAVSESGNEKYAFTYDHEIRITKKSDAFPVFIDKGDSDAVGIRTATHIMRPENRYPWRPGKIVKYIIDQLNKEGITFCYHSGDVVRTFNMWVFGLFKESYSMNGDERYSYNEALRGERPHFIYSTEAASLVIEEIKRNSNGDAVISKLKQRIEQAR
jgi:hypothetical protein